MMTYTPYVNRKNDKHEDDKKEMGYNLYKQCFWYDRKGSKWIKADDKTRKRLVDEVNSPDYNGEHLIVFIDPWIHPDRKTDILKEHLEEHTKGQFMVSNFEVERVDLGEQANTIAQAAYDIIIEEYPDSYNIFNSEVNKKWEFKTACGHGELTIKDFIDILELIMRLFEPNRTTVYYESKDYTTRLTEKLLGKEELSTVSEQNDRDLLGEFNEIITNMRDIYAKKNADYGNSFENSLNLHGLVAGIVRIGDKYSRISNLSNPKTSEINFENIEDSLLDLANYSIMTLMWLKNVQK